MKNLTYGKLKLPYVRDRKTDRSAILGFTGKYAFLSNFYQFKYQLHGETFHSSEQGYMWEKDTSVSYRTRILSAKTPSACKRVGRTARLPEGWDSVVRYTKMYEHVLAKFSVPYMRDRLLATGTAYLEETNSHKDNHWGVTGGIGENHLGRILMCVRYALQTARNRKSLNR